MNPQKDYQQKFQDMLTSTPFPAEKISIEWKRAGHKALMKNGSLLGLGINHEDFGKMIDFCLLGTDEISCYHFATISNHIQRQSPNDMELSPTRYCMFMEDADKLVKIYQEITAPLIQELDREVEEEMAMRRQIAMQQKLGLGQEQPAAANNLKKADA
jgi:hypothetical protein